MIHNKKILSKYYNEVINGNKTFGIRKKDDCIYNVGDYIILMEIDNDFVLTGNRVQVLITYRLDSKDFPEAIKEGYVILGIK